MSENLASERNRSGASDSRRGMHDLLNDHLDLVVFCSIALLAILSYIISLANG
jgi:hypothetical protein